MKPYSSALTRTNGASSSPDVAFRNWFPPKQRFVYVLVNGSLCLLLPRHAVQQQACHSHGMSVLHGMQLQIFRVVEWLQGTSRQIIAGLVA